MAYKSKKRQKFGVDKMSDTNRKIRDRVNKEKKERIEKLFDSSGFKLEE